MILAHLFLIASSSLQGGPAPVDGATSAVIAPPAHWFQAKRWREAEARLLFEAKVWNRLLALEPGDFFLVREMEPPAGWQDALRELSLRGFDTPPEVSRRHAPPKAPEIDRVHVLQSPELLAQTRIWSALAMGLAIHEDHRTGRSPGKARVLSLRESLDEADDLDQRAAAAWGIALTRDSLSRAVLLEWLRDPGNAPILPELLEASIVMDAPMEQGFPDDLILGHLEHAAWDEWLRFAPAILAGPRDSRSLRRFCDLAHAELVKGQPATTPGAALDLLSAAWTDHAAALLLAAFLETEPGSPMEAAAAAALLRIHSALAFHDDPRSNAPAASWLGQPVQVALDYLGPPDVIRLASDDLQHWRWQFEDLAGRPMTRVVSLHLDTIVHMDLQEALAPLERRSLPGTGAYLGQSVQEFLQRAGPADAVRATPVHSHPGGTGTLFRRYTVLVHGDQWTTLWNGRVVGVGPAPPPQPVFGPR